MVVGESKRAASIMEGIENTGDVRLHDHRLRLKQRFDIVRKLGQGTYGKVQLGINKKTGQEVAIKTIKKCKIESEADLVRIRREVQIMSSVRHPNIVHIYEVFENSEKMILVMEYCSGGELYDYLSQKKVLQEDEARRLFRQIATAVYYCHIHKICHRDLKLENVLLDDTGSAKIADFGLSNVFKETSLLSTFCGSPLYASPEIVKGTAYIGPEVDCWSLGVLLYTLVYGAMPFDGSNFKRLVRQISNGDYYEPKSPSTASPLIRDMLTVDPLKRADIAYICDHPWVNSGCESSCLEEAESLAAETPVRLDLLLSLAPAANNNAVVVPSQTELGPEESNTDLTSSTSMAVEPSNSAEKRILDLVAEGGEDAIKPSPTRTIVNAGDGKRKLEVAMSASGLQRKKERVASVVHIPAEQIIQDENKAPEADETTLVADDEPPQQTLKSSATIVINPTPMEEILEIKETPKEAPKEEVKEKPSRPRVSIKKKPSQTKVEDKATNKQDEVKQEEVKPVTVASTADKLTSLSIEQPAAKSTVEPKPKPKKISIPGGNVGSFKEQFERRASLTNTPEVKRNVSKPVVSKIAKPKAQSEDRELIAKPTDNTSVRLQQIGIEPSSSPPEDAGLAGGVKKTESEPSHATSAVDPSVLLQDARRSLQNSMAKLVEEKSGEENRRRAARDIISTAIRTGKPPVPYGRSSSAGVTSLTSPPITPPAIPSTAPTTGPSSARTFRTEATHRVHDHRNNSRGVSVERIIPISVAEEGSESPQPTVQTKPTPQTPKINHTPLRRLVSNESASSETCSTPGEPIKKSAREFIIPIAVEGKGYVTPRQRSLEPEANATRHVRTAKPRRISSLVSGGESEEEDESQMHRLRSSRLARAESVSSGEEEEDDEGFHLLTAENLFSTLLHRVRALTNRLNGEEGPGFSQHPHPFFNNLQSPFFNSSSLSRRHNALREGWGSRDLHADFDSMFSKRQPFPRGSTKKSSKHQTRAPQNAETNVESGLDLSDLDLSSIELSEKEMETLSGLTPALSRRLQKQLLAQLPPAAARTLRRTLSLHSAANTTPRSARPLRSQSAAANTENTDQTDSASNDNRSPLTNVDEVTRPTIETIPAECDETSVSETNSLPPQYSTLPRPKRHSTISRESTPPATTSTDAGYDFSSKFSAKDHSRESSIRSTPDRPLLSKYLTPERTLSLDESYSSDSGSILSEPSYIAAYGTPAISSLSGLGLRRHSMRLATDAPRKRISRFLRPDFFDTSQDESVYAKHKKERELETQEVLREIREKKNRGESILSPRSPTESSNLQQILKDESNSTRKCLSPVAIISAKERSRSNTPFFPILDNIKESTLDATQKYSYSKTEKDNNNDRPKTTSESSLNKESKLIRPKSYPVKTEESPIPPKDEPEKANKKDIEIKDVKDSKLLRPKSYPASSPSPEKVYITRTIKRDKSIDAKVKPDISGTESRTDVEVTFSISLPKKKSKNESETEVKENKSESINAEEEKSRNSSEKDSVLVLKKYKVVENSNAEQTCNVNKTQRTEKNVSMGNGKSIDALKKNETQVNEEPTVKSSDELVNKIIKNDEKNSKQTSETSIEKKPTIKKKIIRKVSSKTKADVGENQDKTDAKVVEKKKVMKKLKDKINDDLIKSMEGKKETPVVKKKSVLQSLGQKFEKLTSTKSNSPDKEKIDKKSTETKKETTLKLSRNQREQSVPVQSEPSTESNLIKRAVTVTDVAVLDNPITVNKTTVSKVLGLFKKFDSKEKVNKTEASKPNSETINESNHKPEKAGEIDSEKIENDIKPKRPTSLLLNGLSSKSKYNRTASDSVSVVSMPNCTSDPSEKKDESKNIGNSLKLDFSRLPRVKKIVPTNPVIEPQIINEICTDTEKNSKDPISKDTASNNGVRNIDILESRIRSRSRSKSDNSNSDTKAEQLLQDKELEKINNEYSNHHPHRNHETTTPDKEDIVDRIRRKSFYTRFNEKRQRRKSNLVGPGAVEYDPLARLHSQPTESKYDVSPTSPVNYDISPGFSSVASDLSPLTERYRSLITELPNTSRNNSRFDNYGVHDKVDSYRSLDRNDFRKYPSSKSYVDYDPPPAYGNRYTRTLSLLDSSDGTDEPSYLKEPHKYSRTLSLYAPGSYATYRPKRVRNSAIILKESEKEPSPENILDKIKQKKISISVTRKAEPEKEPQSRSSITSKSEGDSAERVEKVD